MLLAIAFFAFLTIAFTAPTTKRCDALIEQSPWIVTNLVAFEAAATSQNESRISFGFCDTNKGLELDTNCSRTVAPGSRQSIVDGAYYTCENDDVRFIWSGDQLSLERSYEDPCIGPYPYDGAIAYGQASTSVVKLTTPDGNTCSQDELFVEITELSA